MLLRYRTEGVSVIAVLDRRRRKKNGLFPVKIEVVHMGSQRYFRTGQDVSAETWENRSWKRNIPEEYYEILDSFDRIKTEVKRLVTAGRFSLPALDGALRKGRQADLIRCLSDKMAAFLANGQVNSYYRYRSTARALERMGVRSLPIDEVTTEWLRSFHVFLRGEGKGNATINIYMSALKAVLSESVRNGLMEPGRMPFGRGKYTLPPSSPRDVALKDVHISRIMSYKGTVSEEKYRDLWLFSYLCNGINFRDMLFLKYRDIIDGEICFIRSKTSCSRPHLIRCTVTPMMDRIIRRWGNENDGSRDTYIFRYAKGGETPMETVRLVRKVTYLCNKYLKRIAENLGIPHLTVGSARHSFATVLYRRGVDISLISECLGHSSVAITQNYLSGSDPSSRKRMAAILAKSAE